MRITALRIQNYRTISDLTISFDGYYTALCGKNDSGKTNILRAIGAVFGENGNPFEDRETISPKTDSPRWLGKESKDCAISITLTCTIDAHRDAGVHRFLRDYLQLADQGEMSVQIVKTCAGDKGSPLTSVQVNGNALERIQAQEVTNKLQSANVLLFHNSTWQTFPFVHDPTFELLGDLSGPERTQLESAKNRMNETVKKIARQQQKAIADLLGRLSEKYKVGVSAPEFNPSRVPLAITLGEDSVELEQWGSGTRNRTKILLTLFRARRVSEQETSASKVTPVIIVEEPESFLHPSAQAEFGSMIQDLADEFAIQVIVATHSPYMLSTRNPSANLLLRRRIEKRRQTESELVDTRGENWMEPFGLALGLSNSAFEPWHKALFQNSNAILLVEGSTDKEYFEMLRDLKLGDNALQLEGEVVVYGGKDYIKNPFLLRFIRQRHRSCVVTYDLDVEGEVLPALTGAEFKKGTDCLGLGTESVRSIEGLLPEQVVRTVQSANTDLVNTLAFGTSDQRKSAKSRYKKLLLEEFKRVATPSGEHYGKFFPFVKTINRALRNNQTDRLAQVQSA